MVKVNILSYSPPLLLLLLLRLRRLWLQCLLYCDCVLVLAKVRTKSTFLPMSTIVGLCIDHGIVAGNIIVHDDD